MMKLVYILITVFSLGLVSSNVESAVVYKNSSNGISVNDKTEKDKVIGYYFHAARR